MLKRVKGWSTECEQHTLLIFIHSAVFVCITLFSSCFLNLGLPPRPPKREAPVRKRRGTGPVEPADHVTGCARSEGYYKIDMREKVKYLPHHRLKNSTQQATDVKVGLPFKATRQFIAYNSCRHCLQQL